MTDTRAQAFTLEGIVGSAIVATALLFATQAVVVTPTTGGAGGTNQQSLGLQTNDALAISARAEGLNLSQLTRYWSSRDRTFAGDALNERAGYGPNTPPGPVGELLRETFADRSYTYNLVMRYPDGAGGYEETAIVLRGSPPESAVVGTYTLTLYDDQVLTAPDASPNTRLTEYDTDAGDGDDGYYPVPDAVDGPVYNVVEVRLVVW
jgi:hypothetical protein